MQKAKTKSGPMEFVKPVAQAAQSQAPQGSEVASTASSGSSVSAASPPVSEGPAGQPAK